MWFLHPFFIPVLLSMACLSFTAHARVMVMNIFNVYVNNISILFVSIFGMSCLLLVLRKLAFKIGLVDVPNSRKIHEKPVPLVGGLALFIMLPVILSITREVNVFLLYLIIASGMVVLIGLLDDIFKLSAYWRFFVQILACLMMVYFTQVHLITFGELLLLGRELSLGVLAIPITVFGVVGIINALNMADGIDGLAAMTFCIPVLVLVAVSNDVLLGLWLLMMVACVVVFFMFNKSHNNKVFLGDNGSLLLGFILSWLLVYFSQGNSAVIKPVSALYLVGLPLYDTIFVMLSRAHKGHSLFKPDKTHLHHLFLEQGWSQTKVLMIMLSLQSLLIFLGMLFLKINLSEHYQFYLFVVLSAVYYYSIKRLWSKTLLLKDKS